MQIISIQLENIKSHRDTVIAFAPGINVLSGPNGVGKSTIFEAIGYALFGVDARDFVSNVDRFISIGERRGKIGVTFVTNQGDTYRATRTVGTPANWRLARERDGEFEIEDHAGMEETEARIKELLGLTGGRSLAEQFKLVIGPFQNEFLGPFVQKQQTKRKEAFDEILGIDSWRKTFDGTKEMGTALKASIATLEVDIAGRQERIAVLPERQQEFQELTAQQVAKTADLGEKTALLAATMELLQQMEERKKAIETLQITLARIEQHIASGHDHLATQKILVQEAEAAARTLDAARAGQERYQAAEKNLMELRDREKLQQALEKDIAALGNRQASALQAAEHEEREAAEQEQLLVEGQQALKKQHEDLERAVIDLAERERKQLQAVSRHQDVDELFRGLPIHGLHTIVPYVKGSLKRLAEIDLLVHEKQALLAAEVQWQEKAEALDSLRQERDMLQGEKAKLQGRRTGILEGEEKLAEGLCPYIQDRCQNLEGKVSLDVFSEKKRHIESQIKVQTTAIAALDALIAQAEIAAREMEKFRLLRHEIESLMDERRQREQERLDYLKLLDHAAVVETFCLWVDTNRLDQCREEGEKLVAADFSGAPSDQLLALEQWEQGCHAVAEAVRGTLGKMALDLEQPLLAIRAEQASGTALSAELIKRTSELAAVELRVAQRRKAAGEYLQSATAAAKEQEEKAALLLTFADVEDAIKKWEEDKKQTRPDHERFLQAEPTALQLPKRQEMLARYDRRLEELEQERCACQGQMAALTAEYSAENHQQAQHDKEQLQKVEAELRESLRNLVQNLKRIAEEVVLLKQVQAGIVTQQAAVKELRKKEELVKFLRNRVFKNVSAQLSERFREEISLRADSIYRTIAESDEELYWGDNYQIVLKDLVGGTVRERSDDQLSGGQIMSAVVALRLALLQTIGARFAFFDEPTSNLDACRRENLARAFRAIDHGKEEVTGHWYDQLFLISHDVSFTEITDQVIDLSAT